MTKLSQGLPANLTPTALNAAFGGRLNVRAYGAKGDGITDDAPAINAAIAAAMPTAGTVFFPPGQYLLNAPLIVSPAANATAHYGIAVPSLIGDAGAGRIGDVDTDLSGVLLIAGPTFPIGEYLIDYYPAGNANNNLLGASITGFSIRCNYRAAGLRVVNRRRFWIANISIDGGAVPNPALKYGDYGAALECTQNDMNASAYNTIINCTVTACNLDGIHVDGSQDWLFGCVVFGAGHGRDNFVFKNLVTAVACESDDAGRWSWNVYSGNDGHVHRVTVIGSSSFTGGTAGSQVVVQGQGTLAGHVSFIGCSFDGAGDTVVQPMVTLYNPNMYVTFEACNFYAKALTTTYVTCVAGSAGAALFNNCTFDGLTTGVPYVLNSTNYLRFSNCVGVADRINENPIAAAAVLTQTAIGRTHACTLSSVAFTLTLPTPVGAGGQQISVRVTGASTKLLTLATAAGTIDGTATRIMWAGEYAILQSDDAQWVKIGGKSLPMQATMYETALQNLPSGAVTTILLDTALRDNTGLMVSVAGNRILINRPGTYAVISRLALGNPATNLNRVINMVQKNAAGVAIQQEQSNIIGGPPTFAAVDDLILAAGDYIQMQAYQVQNTPAPMALTIGNVANSLALTAREVPTW